MFPEAKGDEAILEAVDERPALARRKADDLYRSSGRRVKARAALDPVWKVLVARASADDVSDPKRSCVPVSGCSHGIQRNH